ncbi:Arginine--tRNA ligase [Candidatus Hydrogenisulfobacillus filiaventi]|uniref:Arginine--tRNA ligase n=1 Tax=Candidatus Hydrogenisulfobacillus filiaventi TaxID=2707344 RepID=A0A6F8ZJW2_9FIRM|nr:arginine--tRNA ligase [Bacillota bacterium]CAB1130234.1 Arginine--tRNA ligase [Candidatus Hydrogenisulfobacillus filiaventi]
MKEARLPAFRAALAAALERALAGMGLEGLAAEVVVEPPTEAGHGDLTSNIALKGARVARRRPADLAAALRDRLEPVPGLAAVEVAGPGFLNFTLDTRWLAGVVADITADPAAYGRSNLGAGQRVLIEFVSANPTGPLVLVNGRAAALGDSLARILRLAGYAVDREFYVNDAGNQVTVLGQAMALRLWELDSGQAVDPWPEGVYPGEYVRELAARYRAEHPDQRVPAPDDPQAPEWYPALGAYAAGLLRHSHEEALRRFGVTFERWYSERGLREAGGPERVLDRLRAGGYLEERDGALWFRSTLFGDDKDRVMVKSDGSYTYFVPDAAYHLDKFERGYDAVIDLLGPDHHGYVARLKAVVAALGYPADRLEVLIVQVVHLVRGGRPVRMSKRQGQFVTLDDLLDEVGVDAARYFFVERAPDTPLDFDLDLAALRGNENPVYYIQYAGTRIKSVLRQAEAESVPPAPFDPARLQEPLERALCLTLARFPDVLAFAAQARAPQHLARYLHGLAGDFHAFYKFHRILEAEPTLRRARLDLARAVLAVLEQGAGALGISLPDTM